MAGDFRFKRFAVSQSGCAMKVGTDGVLLGAWCTVRPEFKRALDIGSGTGVIAIMLAQRSEGWGMAVDAVEIDMPSFLKARENAAVCEWAGRIAVRNCAVQDYMAADNMDSGSGGSEPSPVINIASVPACPGKYDLIVSNPPYFNDSLLPPDTARTNARHTTTLTHEELLGNSLRLLAPCGVLSVILPYPQADGFAGLAETEGFFLSRRTDVYPTPKSLPKRSLMEFMKIGGDASAVPVSGNRVPPGAGSLVIENAPLDYTAEYMELTKDFYLKF